MKLSNLAIILLIIAGGLWTGYQINTERANQTSPLLETPTEFTSGFVVVELFTSQGCYSCPPADDNLRELYAEAAEKGIEIIPLAFHVDYWNYLGWKDIYSDKAFSTRQRQYAKALNSGVYTPQMVFNGQSECVGSRRSDSRSLIQQALTKKPLANIDLSPEREGNIVQVQYQLSGNVDGKILHLALVETGLEVDIARGENGGKKLRYDHVVRDFEALSIDTSQLEGGHKLQIPADSKAENLSVVAFVQEGYYGEIVGAIRTEI